jgi:integrase/recombinase XerC
VSSPTGDRADEGQDLTDAIADFIVHLTAERGLSGNTARAYRIDLESLRSFTEQRDCKLEHVTLDLLRDWLWAGSQGGLARATIARRSASARGFTAWLARTGRAESDPGLRLR